jgi:O-succinylhomoserine sulfhydrylase
MADITADAGNSGSWRARTLAVRGGTQRSEFGETSEAIFLNSGYVYDGPETAEARFRNEAEGFVYSRYGNPTVEMFEQRIAGIEGAEQAWATASGMAAVNASMLALVKAGDHVVSSRALFFSCRYIVENVLPRLGVETTLVDGTDLDQWRDAVRPETVCAFLESPSNPMLEIIDITAVAEIVHSVDARLIVDNAFASPVLQKPFELGADVAVYSATKHIDGQGRCLGGAVLADRDFCKQILEPFMRHTGPSMSPFNAWVMLKGLETLDLRVAQHCVNALEVATGLSAHPKVERLLYPGLDSHPQHALAMRQMRSGGGIVTFDVGGGKEGAFRFLKALRVVDISNNLGDAKSLITHPATTTHLRLAEEDRLALRITPGTVRISVGLEDVADIKDDLLQALEAV